MNSKPKPPFSRIIKEGATKFCLSCGSSVSINGFLGICGELLCDNPKCEHSKTKKNYK